MAMSSSSMSFVADDDLVIPLELGDRSQRETGGATSAWRRGLGSFVGVMSFLPSLSLGEEVGGEGQECALVV